jgi:hypothetical protein
MIFTPKQRCFASRMLIIRGSNNLVYYSFYPPFVPRVIKVPWSNLAMKWQAASALQMLEGPEGRCYYPKVFWNPKGQGSLKILQGLFS